MSMIPETQNHTQFFVEVRTPKDHNPKVPVLVNCVDVQTNELVWSWLLILDVISQA